MRLFVAFEIPNETREALAGLIARLKPKCSSARWVQPEGMHLTLKFIGHTSADNVPAIRKALSSVRSSEAVAIHFRGLGFFPSEGQPRVMWCGAEASANTVPLASDIDRSLGQLGIEPETRAFAPHLTLARFKGDEFRKRGQSEEDCGQLVAIVRDLPVEDFGKLRTPEFHLFESKLSRSGAEYTRLETFHFVQAAN
jgi:2'-5' RNA ligase